MQSLLSPRQSLCRAWGGLGCREGLGLLTPWSQVGNPERNTPQSLKRPRSDPQVFPPPPPHRICPAPPWQSPGGLPGPSFPTPLERPRPFQFDRVPLILGGPSAPPPQHWILESCGGFPHPFLGVRLGVGGRVPWTLRNEKDGKQETHRCSPAGLGWPGTQSHTHTGKCQ